MQVNLNQYCLIRETERGRIFFNAHFDDLHLDQAVYRTTYTQPDGRMKMQLWQVAHIYGRGMALGETPVETTIEILEEETAVNPYRQLLVDIIAAEKNRILSVGGPYESIAMERIRRLEDRLNEVDQQVQKVQR